MRLAFFGDVVGRSGRDGLAEHLPNLRRRLGLEFVIVNAENAAAGFGITENTARDLFAAGADCLTLGNHSWDQREALVLVGASGFSYEEAAGICGCAVGTIKSRVNRARSKLSALLYVDGAEDFGPDETVRAVIGGSGG